MLIVAEGAAPADAVPPRACGEGVARPRGCEYTFTLAPEGYGIVFGRKGDGSLDYRLPRLKLFDFAGLLRFESTGYPNDLSSLLDRAMESSERKAGPTLGEVMSLVRPPGGPAAAAPGPGAADFSIVAYEADWCLPCKKQLEEIRSFGDRQGKVTVNILRVDADLARLDPEAQRSLLGGVIHPPKVKKQKKP